MADGVAITITLHDEPLQAAIAALAGFQNGSLYPALDAIGAAMESKTQLRFIHGVDPNGNPWPPSKRAIRENGQTLMKSRRLFRSITFNNLLPTVAAVEWGSNVIYAAIHQFGGTIRAHTQAIYRKVKKDGEFALHGRFVKKALSNYMTQHAVGDVTIPARPYLGIDADDRETIAQILAKFLQRAIDLASRQKT